MSGMEPMLAMAAIQAGSTIAGGIGQNNAAKASAKVDEENARLATYQGELDAVDIMRAERRQAGQAIVDLAGSGVLVGEGSARDILEQSAMQREIDILRTRRQADGEARNLLAKAADTRAAGKASLVGSIFSAVSGAIQGTRDARASQTIGNQRTRERSVILGQPGGASGDIRVTRGGGFF